MRPLKLAHVPKFGESTQTGCMKTRTALLVAEKRDLYVPRLLVEPFRLHVVAVAVPRELHLVRAELADVVAILVTAGVAAISNIELLVVVVVDQATRDAIAVCLCVADLEHIS